MFMDENDKLLDVAVRESAYLHDYGLFDASRVIDELLKQRAVLLEALKEAEARINDMLEGYDVHEALKEARKSLPRIKSTIAKAEAVE